MALAPPTSLSPSRVASFQDCALAFRFSAIDKLPEPPSLPATRGTLVHAALERLFCAEPQQRTIEHALVCLTEAADAMADDPDLVDLHLDDDEHAKLMSDAEVLVHKYFMLEDPTTITPIGIELKLQAKLNGLALRGVIDRLELDADGRLVVTDYKTGRAPNERYEQGRLGGVHFYSFLCEELFGQRPARIQLLYLADPIAIVSEPTEQSTRGLRRKVGAIWKAVESACERENFGPRPGKLCDWCSFKEFCPAFGGDPTRAVALVDKPEPAADPLVAKA
jgi:putative RecB family exonuclease